eukprot:2274022-Rhodomonas_salina.1
MLAQRGSAIGNVLCQWNKQAVGFGVAAKWRRLSRSAERSPSSSSSSPATREHASEKEGSTGLLEPITCPVLLKVTPADIFRATYAQCVDGVWRRAWWNQELEVQRQRCTDSNPETENLFEHWCRKSGGVLHCQVAALKTCFRVHPFPDKYFMALDQFQDRVLGPAGSISHIMLCIRSAMLTCAMLMPGVKVSRKILLSTAFMHKSWLNCGA